MKNREVNTVYNVPKRRRCGPLSRFGHIVSELTYLVNAHKIVYYRYDKTAKI